MSSLRFRVPEILRTLSVQWSWLGLRRSRSSGSLGLTADALTHSRMRGYVIPTTQGEYELVEGIHAIVLHIFTKYFKEYFDHVFVLGQGRGAVHDAASSSADDRTYASL